MMEEILIADLKLTAHAQATLDLLNEYAQEEAGGSCGLSDYVKANLIHELLQRKQALVLLAFVQGVPAGLVIALEGFSTFACKPLLNIHDLMVSAEFRGRGLAKRLLARAEVVAMERGCCKLTLEVLQGNAAAQALYRACGYAGYALKPQMGIAQFWQKPLPPAA